MKESPSKAGIFGALLGLLITIGTAGFAWGVGTGLAFKLLF